MKKLNIAYFGTPSFSALFLEKLITDVSINRLIEIKFVFTQPDRKVGRKQILTPTPVKIIANKYKLPVYEVGKWKLGIETGQENGSKIPLPNPSSLFHNIDLTLVFAFGQIIPKELLNLLRYGFINVHPSLLPKYRGPSPIAYPLINGDATTGVSLIKMDEEIDHGSIIAQEKLNILPNDRRPDLEIKLTDLAFKMFKEYLAGGERRGAPTSRTYKLVSEAGAGAKQDPPITQNHSLATYTKLLKKSDGFIPLSTIKKALNNQPFTHNELPPIIRNLKLEIRNSPKIIYNYFRGLYPWPGLWTTVEPLNESGLKRLKIIDLEFVNNEFRIKKVQLEGKKEVDFETFNRAYKIF